MSEQEYKVVSSQSGTIIHGYAHTKVFQMTSGKYYDSIGDIKATDYPKDTKIRVTIETPEPPKRIVLPLGTEWIDHYNKQSDVLDYSTLFTIDGLKIAKILHMVTYEYFCICFAPWDRESIKFYKKTLEEGKEEVLEVCARNNWYGITKTNT